MILMLKNIHNSGEVIFPLFRNNGKQEKQQLMKNEIKRPLETLYAAVLICHAISTLEYPVIMSVLYPPPHTDLR